MEARTDLNRNPVNRDELPAELVRDMDRDDLSRLVREVNDTGISFQKIADRAIDPQTGTTLSKPYIQKISTNSVANPPTPDRLRALAAGLNKPLTVVQRAAAAQWLDYEATELSGYDDDVRVIVAHLAGMTRNERRRWLAMIEAAEQASREEE